MKYLRLLLVIFALSLVACSGGGGGGGEGTPTDPGNPDTTPPSEGSIRSCTVSNGSGVEQYLNGQWGVCTVLNCDSGFNISGNSCQAQGNAEAPMNLAYPQKIAVFRGQNVSPILPSHDGGLITSYQITPALPSGITFDTETGKISGVGFIESSEKTYTVVGTGPGGSDITTVNVEVREPVPTYLAYTRSNPTYVVGQEISSNSPNTDYELSITGYSITPALPTGLLLNTSDGVISGTPSGELADTDYTITASYDGGSVSALVNINIVVPPTNFQYTQSNYSLSVGEPFPDIVPNYTGPAWPAVSFVVDEEAGDALPNGVVLNSSNGKLYTPLGSYPNTDTPPRNIVVKVFVQDSPSIFLTANVIISVSSAPTTNLRYNISSMLYRKLEPFPANYPLYDGQAPDGDGDQTDAYKICLTSDPSSCEGKTCGSLESSCNAGAGDTKVLPQGISFSSVTGRITGSSDYIVPSTDYTVTAKYSAGSGGEISTVVNISIVEELPSFIYNVNSLVLRKNENLADTYSPAFLTPINSNTNVAITGWVIDKPLPAGMNFDGAISQGLPQDASAGGTGGITGKPTEISSLTNYTISACNSDGCASQDFSIRVYSVMDQLVTGKNHACVIFTDENNKLYCWGDNQHGQLGFTSTDSCSGATDCSKTGGFVKLVSGNFLENVRKVSLGDNHSCAMVGPETAAEYDLFDIYCWGDNREGQLGINSSVASANRPQLVKRGLNAGESFADDALDLAIGGNDSCYLSSNVIAPTGDGLDYLLRNIFCWGESYTSRAELIPGQEDLGFFTIDYGVNHGCALIYNQTVIDPRLDGRVFCWGSNEYSKLGSTGGDSTEPELVTSTSSFSGMERITLGQDHSCSLNTNEEMFCWGSNYYGQFGISSGVGNFSTTFSNPVSTGITTDFLYGNGFMGIIASGFSFQYFGKTPIVGGVYTQASQPTPTAIKYYTESTLLDFPGSLSSSGASSEDFACIASTFFDIHCWGSNTSGKLGTGDETSQELPTRANFSF